MSKKMLQKAYDKLRLLADQSDDKTKSTILSALEELKHADEYPRYGSGLAYTLGLFMKTNSTKFDSRGDIVSWFYKNRSLTFNRPKDCPEILEKKIKELELFFYTCSFDDEYEKMYGKKHSTLQDVDRSIRMGLDILFMLDEMNNLNPVRDDFFDDEYSYLDENKGGS